MYSEMNAQTLYKNTINSLNHEILSFENNAEGLDNPIDAIGLNKLTNKLKEYQGILNTSLAQYNEFLKETSSQKEFERYANEKIKANRTNTETTETTETPETPKTSETSETPEPGDTDDFENPFIEPETDLETEEDYPSNETDEATHQGILELYEEDQKRKQQEGQQQQQQGEEEQQQGEEEQQQQQQ